MNTKHKALALLLDPEKADLNSLPISSEVHPDYIFVGGSTGGDTTAFVRALKSKIEKLKSNIPIVLFPGDSSQFTPEADAVLFLSLLSGNNPEYLVNQQIKSARAISDSKIDFVPTAYILIDGGVETSTMRVTQTKPLDPADMDAIVNTCIAAELMGKQAIYLEAGSGAINPVSADIIRAVRSRTSVTLIVGGGIRTPEAMNAAYNAGADIVVIGNHFESHPETLQDFCLTRPTNPTRPNSADDEKYMRLALAEARKALAADEIPVGCVIVSQNQIIGRGHNLTETLSDVTAHAEIQAITAAAQTLGGKYLTDATLYVTVEPCVMCAGAIGWAQIARIVYGASDPKRGFATYAPKAFHPKAQITSGVLESECRELIQEFFKSKR
ncbi:MAG: phosphoglycerol geranylgeranyltransferase [Paludibacteraceae bacterium]|nr:phosphoglycerol geranylgeranyltransferase [Paludibacteraceae bacterium]